MSDNVAQMEAYRKLTGKHVPLEPELPLFGGGGGGTLPPMDIVDAKIAATEARTDVKFAKMEGKLDLILEKLSTVQANSADARSEARTTRRTVIGTGLSLAGLMAAMFALFSNGFNLGTKVSDLSRDAARATYVEMAPARPPATEAKATSQKPTNKAH